MQRVRFTSLMWLFVLSGCTDGGAQSAERGQTQAGAEAGNSCQVVAGPLALPDEVRETSGLAWSGRPGLFWTHNDAGSEADLFAIDASGGLVSRVRVRGLNAVDWEDIGRGPCEGGNCLFVADIGDNDGSRENITVYRVAEPSPGSSEAARGAAITARYPDGPHDAEAIIVLPGGEIYLVTKGRSGPITLYRYPGAPARSGTLERVRELWPEPKSEEDRVTGATASPDGRWVHIRTYRNLYIYPTPGLTGTTPAEPMVVDLSPLGESQGESVIISNDGEVWTTSEAERESDRPALARMKCTLNGS